MSDTKQTDIIYKKVIAHKIKTDRYPDKIYMGVDIYSEIVCEYDNRSSLYDPINKKFMNIQVIIVEESGHLSFDAHGVDKNQFVEAPLFLLK